MRRLEGSRIFYRLDRDLRRRGQALEEPLPPHRERSFISSEINTELSDAAQLSTTLEQIAGRYANGHVCRMDGMSEEFPTWHFNMGPSNTKPVLPRTLEDSSQQVQHAPGTLNHVSETRLQGC